MGVTVSLGVACLAADARPARSQTPSLVTKMISVDGRPIRVRTAGLDARNERQAIVIFESGATSPLETWDSILPRVAVFQSIGSTAAARDSFYAIMERSMVNAPAALRSEGAATMAIFKADLAERKLPSAPPVPTTVLVAGKPAALPPTGLPFDSKRFAEAAYSGRLHSLRRWVREPGQFIVAANSGHMIHLTEPELVIEAIRRLVR